MHSNAELGINVGWNWAWYRSGLSVIGGLDYQKRDPGSTHTKARRGKMDSRLNGLVDIAGLPARVRKGAVTPKESQTPSRKSQIC